MIKGRFLETSSNFTFFQPESKIMISQFKDICFSTYPNNRKRNSDLSAKIIHCGGDFDSMSRQAQCG